MGGCESRGEERVAGGGRWTRRGGEVRRPFEFEGVPSGLVRVREARLGCPSGCSERESGERGGSWSRALARRQVAPALARVRSRFSPRTTASVAPLRELRPPRRSHTRPRPSHPVHLPPPSASPSSGKSRTQPHLAPSLHRTPDLRPIASQLAVRKVAQTAGAHGRTGRRGGSAPARGPGWAARLAAGELQGNRGTGGGTSSAYTPPSRSGELTFALPLAAQSPCRTTR